MKKLFSLLVVFFMFITTIKAEALSFEDAFTETNKTPMVLLIYANWAENYQSVQEQYKQVQAELGSKFNFVELDIASNEAKAFNDKFHIYPKLPYILMFRDGGKVSRYIPRDCASSASCVSSKLRSFIQ